ncbi:MAG TPA: alkaline phosphatase family protein [Actinomycetes bacterium]|nr:alkaline phosphatase family protein [Actinomycetes bacterium]
MVASASASSPVGAGEYAPTLAHPCGTRAVGPGTYSSVVWIVLENRSYGQVVGSASMPTLNSLARACGLATDMHAVSHPSLPNYLAAVSGSTGGVTADCAPSACPQSRATLFSQLVAAHLSWASYEQDMRSPCQQTISYPYAPKHNPAVYFPDLRSQCLARDLPLGSVAAGPFADSLRAGTVPSFALVVPSLCDDGHDCSNAAPERWLRSWLPMIVASPQYQAGTMAVVVTYDEGVGGYAGETCSTSADGSCRVAAVVAAASTRPGTRSATFFSHYSLLRTTEELLGLPGHLGAAAAATSMRAAFHL